MIIVAYNLVGCNSEDVLRLRGKEPIDLLYKLKHRPVLVKENQNRTVQMEEGENQTMQSGSSAWSCASSSSQESE